MSVQPLRFTACLPCVPSSLNCTYTPPIHTFSSRHDENIFTVDLHSGSSACSTNLLPRLFTRHECMSIRFINTVHSDLSSSIEQCVVKNLRTRNEDENILPARIFCLELGRCTVLFHQREGFAPMQSDPMSFSESWSLSSRLLDVMFGAENRGKVF